MKRVEAQFRRRWRPGRVVLAALATLALCVALAVGADVWAHQRVAALRMQVAQLVEDERNNVRSQAPRVPQAYDASGRQFLRERAAGWAPMLRTLESGSMIGVTPASVEFSASDGSARVELNYSDTATLVDFLSRINEGSSPGSPRWTLIETRVQAGTPSIGLIPGGAGDTGSVASIRSTWLEPSFAGDRTP